MNNMEQIKKNKNKISIIKSFFSILNHAGSIKNINAEYDMFIFFTVKFMVM